MEINSKEALECARRIREFNESPLVLRAAQFVRSLERANERMRRDPVMAPFLTGAHALPEMSQNERRFLAELDEAIETMGRQGKAMISGADYD